MKKYRNPYIQPEEQDIAVKDINLTTLNEFMDSTLIKTEFVQKMLQDECNQANYILSPWKIETEIDEKIEEKCTSVEEENITEQAEDIAHEIDQTLAKVKELRQKTKRSVNDSQRKSIQILKNTLPATKVCNKSSTKAMNCLVVKKASSLTTKKSSPKNFIAQNKLHVKAVSQQNSKIIKSQNNNKSDSKTSLTKAISDLDILIQKVSMNTLKSNVLSTSTGIKNNCSYQENNERIVRKKVRLSLNMVDFLNQFGVPNDLLKKLKVCNYYMAFNVEENSQTGQNAAQKFLDVLEKKNEIRNSKLPNHINNLGKLISNLFKLYQDLDEIKPGDYSPLKRMKIRYRELSSLIKSYNMDKKNYYKANINHKNREDYQYIERGWLSNGLWNWPNNDCSIFSQIEFMNYSRDKQILKFFNLIQQYQLTVYQNNLHDIILSTIIPDIEQNKNLTDKKIIEICKMIYVIVQALNPKTLIVVKTEN